MGTEFLETMTGTVGRHEQETFIGHTAPRRMWTLTTDLTWQMYPIFY